MFWSVIFSFGCCFDKLWCQPPLLPYSPMSNSDLLMLQVVTRRSARTPLHVAATLPHIWRCNHTEFNLYDGAASGPTHVHVSFGSSLLRGGCHSGQLLGRGYDALVDVGRYFRGIYADRLKLLPTVVRFRSTSTHRTLHSAMSFIQGLYPGRVSSDIATADKSVDHWRKTASICPNLKEKLAGVRGSDGYRRAFANRTAAVSDVAAAVGSKHAPDIVMTARCDGRGLESLGLSEEVLDAAALTKAAQQAYVYGDPEVARLVFSFAAGEIVNAMIARLNGDSPVRFIHWSAHDGNILAFLGYLGAHSTLLPPYGSFIATELWKCRDSGQLLVRFIFNGNVLAVPRLGNLKVVEFSQLLKFVREKMPDIVADCGFEMEKVAKGNLFQPDDH
jgi:acid phosphatase